MTYPNWFASTAQANFEQFLRPMSGQPHLKFLQLGAFTGDASEWLLENILTGPASMLDDVDTWKGSDEQSHAEMDFKDVYKVYKNKTKRFTGKVFSYRGSTFDFLLHYAGCCECLAYEFDFIYIDADHTSAGVFLDAELSWRVLKPGGIMAFDDYTWQHESGRPALAPKGGIHMFLDRHAGEYEVLAINLQYWIVKK